MVATALPDPLVFAALGDATRLALFDRLHQAGPLSTTQLAAGVDMSRQAVRKHLGVLAAAGLVHDRRLGRERRWSVDPEPLADAREWMDRIRVQWEARLDRLDAFLIDNPD